MLTPDGFSLDRSKCVNQPQLLPGIIPPEVTHNLRLLALLKPVNGCLLRPCPQGYRFESNQPGSSLQLDASQS